MRLRRLFETTQDYVPKKVDPALMTFQEYYELVNPKDKYHPRNAYDMDLSKINEFMRKTDFDIPIQTVRVNNIMFEIRMRKEDLYNLNYVKYTPEGQILRNENDEPIYYTREELTRLDKKRWEYSIGVFYGDQTVAYTADEWGCMLVVVAREFRGWGFGPIILKIARSIEPDKPSGGFTPQGAYNLQKVYREFVGDYLKSGMYSFLVRSGQLSAERAKAIIQSAQQAYVRKPKEQFNLKTDDPRDWLLYVGEAGDFILYDRKLKDLVDRGVVDSEEFSHWVDQMIIGAVYASGRPPYQYIHQFGGKTEPVKMFMMRLALSEAAEHQEIVVFEEPLRPYVTQRGIQIDQNEAKLVADPIAYKAMGMAEHQWRKSFDRFDEFRYRLLELAYGKYQITR